jgi:hypothetical protein
MTGLRRILLRIMLGSLALAALSGASAFLLSEYDTIGRVVGTCFAAAVAAVLLLFLSLLADREKTRAAGLFGMGLVLTEFILTLVMIWGEPLFHWDIFWRFGATAGWLAPVGLAVMVYLFALEFKGARWTSRVGLACAGIVYVTFLIGAWTPGTNWWPFSENCWETAGVLSLYSLTASLALLGLGAGDRRYWRWLGVLASLAACTMAVFHIWHPIEADPTLFAALTATAAVVAHACLVMAVPLQGAQVWVRRGAIAMAIVAGVCFTTQAYIEYGNRHRPLTTEGDFLGRAGGAATIVMACATLALLVLARMNRRVDLESLPITQFIQITLLCPRCGRKQTVPLGDAHCGACELRIYTKIEEPRCPQCGYLLYKLTGDHCPECGAAIAKQAAAAPATPS